MSVGLDSLTAPSPVKRDTVILWNLPQQGSDPPNHESVVYTRVIRMRTLDKLSPHPLLLYRLYEYRCDNEK